MDQDITREMVDDALDYLQMTNPKPEVPIHETIVGHLIVAVAQKVYQFEGHHHHSLAPGERH